MSGIDRLRTIAGAWDEWGLGGTLADIADQIEREHAEDADVVAWVCEHGGLERVKKLLDWVLGHCPTKQQLDFDFWLSGRVMHELGFEEDMADRDEVERRLLARLVPDGMAWLVEAWPRFEGGEPVGFGDDVSRHGEDFEANVIALYRDGSFSLNFWAYSKGERVNRPAPKVLDADGVETRVGEMVYHIETGDEFTVVAIDAESGDVHVRWGYDFEDKTGTIGGSYLTHRAPVLAADGKPLEVGQTVYDVDAEADTPLTVVEVSSDLVRCEYTWKDGKTYRPCYPPDQLTHQRPDTWQRIEEDAGCTATKYNERRGTIFTTKQQVARDLVRRAKKLAGVDND